MKDKQTISEVYGIWSKEDHTRIYYNDTTVASGQMDPDSLYRVSSNNDCHVSVAEDGAELMTVEQGHYLASGQQEILGTDGKRKTVQVQRAKTGGTLYLTKLNNRGL